MSCLMVGSPACMADRNVRQGDIPVPTRLSVTLTKQPGDAQPALVPDGSSPILELVLEDVRPD